MFDSLKVTNRSPSARRGRSTSSGRSHLQVNLDKIHTYLYTCTMFDYIVTNVINLCAACTNIKVASFVHILYNARVNLVYI